MPKWFDYTIRSLRATIEKQAKLEGNMAKKDHSNNRRKEYYCVYDAEGRRVFRGTGWSFDDAAERASRINGVPVKQLRAVLDRG